MFKHLFVSLPIVALLVSFSVSLEQRRCVPRQWEATMVGRFSQVYAGVWQTGLMVGTYSEDIDAQKSAFTNAAYFDNGVFNATYSTIRTPVSTLCKRCCLLCVCLGSEGATNSQPTTVEALRLACV